WLRKIKYILSLRSLLPKEKPLSRLAAGWNVDGDFPQGSNPKGLSVSECMINCALLLNRHV
ncbi:hypothetical protein, partial [Brunnivagina elsteri]